MSSDVSTVASPTHNIQDVFLNGARRERLDVAIRLMDGSLLTARIKSFDRFAVVVEYDGADQLIFKHAIMSIRPAKAVRSGSPPA
jgi:host factor-I protein